jgi:hypothetical protein
MLIIPAALGSMNNKPSQTAPFIKGSLLSDILREGTPGRFQIDVPICHGTGNKDNERSSMQRHVDGN